MSKIRELFEKMSSTVQFSPALIHQPAMDALDDIYNNQYDLTDATNPAVNIMEINAATNAAFHTQAAVLSRKLYPALAESFEDLYHHMSDKDYQDRFARPLSEVIIYFGLPADEIRKLAVFDANLGLKKLTIPADTSITAGDKDYYLHWPVDIIVTSDNQLSARYDLSFYSLRDRTSNSIDYRTNIQDGREWFYVGLSVDQVSVDFLDTPIGPTSETRFLMPFTDRFYMAMVWQSKDGGNKWHRLTTTHSDQTFDPMKPTALLKVLNNRLMVSIPEVYLSQGTVSGQLRVVLLTTKGEVEVNMADLDGSDYGWRFNDFLDRSVKYSKPLSEITATQIFSTENYRGGHNGLTFSQLKDRVVYGKGKKPAPYTVEELRTELDGQGFRVSKQKDTVTERVFVASKTLPVSDKEDLTSSAGLVNASVMIDRRRTDLADSIKFKDGLTTLCPCSIFKGEAGSTKILPNSEKRELESLSPRRLAEQLQETAYFYTPFHYVLDETQPSFEARAYYLEEPKKLYSSMIGNNATLGFLVQSENTKVSWDSDKSEYRVVVRANVPGNGDKINAVLNYHDVKTGHRWDMVGERKKISGKQYEYTFVFPVDLDIDKDHNMTFHGMESSQDIPVRLPLEQTTFDLVYVLDGSGPSPFDNLLPRRALNFPATGVSHETVTVEWGRYCDLLYIKTRPILESPKYKKYQSDKPMVWEEDRVAKDSAGYLFEEDAEGILQPVYEHRIGDPVLDEDGNPIYEHRAGDIIYDPITKQPIVEEQTALAREVRLVLIDAGFYFATTDEIKTYSDYLPIDILNTLDKSIQGFSGGILEETRLYFEPISTRATTRAEIEQGRTTFLSTQLSWRIDISLTEAAYNNSGIRSRIEQSVVDKLKEIIKNREISLAGVYDSLNDLSSENVKSITVKSPFTSGNYAKLIDDNAQWSIAAKPISLSNGLLDVVDDIEIVFTL